MNLVNLGFAIKTCRVMKKMTQKDLADLAGISASYVSLIECGSRDIPFSTIQNLTLALDISLIILVFMGSSSAELSELDPIVSEKLSHAAVSLLTQNQKESK